MNKLPVLALLTATLVGCGGDDASSSEELVASGDGGSATDGSAPRPDAAGGRSGGGGSAGTDGSVGTGGRGPGTGGAAGTGGAVGDGGPPLDRPPYDWVGVIGSGQSLSVGWFASTISTTQPFKNLKLQDTGPDPKYPIDGSGSPAWSVVPLTELIRAKVAGSGPGYDDWQYPNNIAGETPHSGMANTLSSVWQARGKTGDYITTHTVVGWSGHCLRDIDKTGTGRAYPASLSEARVLKGLAAAAGKTFGVGGIVLTHGECDSTNTGYGAGLFKMWQDYNADLKAITGQTRDVVLIVSQATATGVGNDSSSVQVWRAGVDHPGAVVCSGPKYQYDYVDGLHTTTASYERIGEKYAEVFDAIVNQNIAWKPLQPSHVSRSGAVITLDFDVPKPPLAWDPHIAAPFDDTAHPAWKAGYGFQVTDGGGADVAIASATIQGSSVVLTLAQTPAAGTQLTVGYAVTKGSGNNPLPIRGQLRDSDDFAGWSTDTLDVNVTQGSPDVSSVSATGFARRAAFDIVTGPSVPADTVIAKKTFDNQITLSAPWPGATGKTTLTLRHDHRNFCVQFSMPVP